MPNIKLGRVKNEWPRLDLNLAGLSRGVAALGVLSEAEGRVPQRR